MRTNKQTHHLVWEAEQAKIALSDTLTAERRVHLAGTACGVLFSQAGMRETCLPLLERIGALADEAVQQAGCTPDAIFVTGGTARSPVIHAWLQQRFAGSKIVVGDHFGSVISGLARWADRCFA